MDKIDEELEKTVLIPAKEAKELALHQPSVLVSILNGLQMANTADVTEVNKKEDR